VTWSCAMPYVTAARTQSATIFSPSIRRIVLLFRPGANRQIFVRSNAPVSAEALKEGLGCA
jgi:hypothetical protein